MINCWLLAVDVVAVVGTVHQTCPPYTTTTEYEPNTCVVVCPAPMLSDGQVHAYTIVNGVLGHVAIVCNLAIFVAYMTHPWKSIYPRSNVAWLQLPYATFVLAYLLGVWLGWERIACDKCGDPDNGYAWIGCWFSHWSWCWLTAWMILFGSMSSAVWYCLVGIGLLISVSEYRMPLSNTVQAAICQVIGTVLPFVYTLALALANEFQPSGAYAPCTFPLDKVRCWLHTPTR